MSSRLESSRGRGRTAEFIPSHLVPIALIVAVLTPLSAIPATAENRFFNPDFDSSTNGWFDHSGSPFTFWDLEDRDGCEGSGSALVSSETTAPFHAFLAQCIPVVEGEILRLEMETKPIFALGPIAGNVEITFSDNSCQEPTASLVAPSSSAPLATWTRFSAELVVPAGYNSAFVMFVLRSSAVFDALYDFAYAGGSNRTLFSDGFEYGSTCRW